MGLGLYLLRSGGDVGLVWEQLDLGAVMEDSSYLFFAFLICAALSVFVGRYGEKRVFPLLADSFYRCY